MIQTNGIHHITAISSSAQKTYDFYTKILGLRLVKKTVNQDAPDVYHLYFADYKATPGTVMTFFPFEDSGTGMRGIGQVATVSFAINKNSIGFWLERFISKGIKHNPIEQRFGTKRIVFYDYDGLQLELVATNEKIESTINSTSEISENNSIKSFYSATLSVGEVEKTEKVLEILGYEKEFTEEFITRYVNKKSRTAKYIELFRMTGWPEGIQSAGTVHHIAFNCETSKDQLLLRKRIIELGLEPTEVIDRYYFKSVYFRESEGILFELATKEPGFIYDEKLEELGSSLVLPGRFEALRSEIEKRLPLLITDEIMLESKYLYKYIKEPGDKLYVLFHGTGGNENDLIPLVINDKASILSLRGDVSENGMLRFFRRFSEGVFDEDDIKERVDNFKEFFEQFFAEHKLDKKDIYFIGYSNGANFIASVMLLYPEIVQKAILIRPTMPLKTYSKNNAQNKSEVLILAGNVGLHATKEDQLKLVDALELKNYKVKLSFTGDDHAIIDKDIEEINSFLSE